MRLTTLKLRQLKPCALTDRMLNSLPDDIQWFGEGMFQFDVKIPTKLWKVLLRRRTLMSEGNSNYATNLTLGQARTERIENDMGTWTYEDAAVLDILDASSPVRRVMPGAVYVSPLYTELFDRFDISVLRSVVLFLSPDIINFNVVLHMGCSSTTVEAIFDVRYFPFPTERPHGALVSFTINV